MRRQYIPGPLPFLPYTQVELTCEQCSIRFLVRKSQLAARRFCSKTCSGLSKRTQVQRTCELCGASFMAFLALVRRGYGRFCSQPCLGRSRNRHVACTCLTCGATFEIKASAQARGEGIYCTPACYHAAVTGVEKLPLADRFWAKVDKDGPVPEHRPELGRCWVWTGYRQPRGGYGLINVAGRAELAHRVAYELEIGPLGDLYACHHCDKPPCVRPEHLFPGTQLDNMRDAAEKGRAVPPPGRHQD